MPAGLVSGLLDYDRLLYRLVSSLDEETRNTIAIIGGQALRIWADRYLAGSLSDSEESFLSSDDLDFLGRKHDVRRCAEAWKARANYPLPGDATPQTGLILLDEVPEEHTPLLDDNGRPRPLIVDFLPDVHGVPESYLRRGLDSLALEGGFEVKILTPALCLTSRLHNLHSLHYSAARIARERVRIRVAARVAREYLIELLEAGEKRRALRWANIILDTCAQSFAVQMSVKHNLDLLDAIPEKHMGFGPYFHQKHYSAMAEKIRRKRESYQQRLQGLAKKQSLGEASGDACVMAGGLINTTD